LSRAPPPNRRALGDLARDAPLPGVKGVARRLPNVAFDRNDRARHVEDAPGDLCGKHLLNVPRRANHLHGRLPKVKASPK
jgi:hypothetical protein